MKRIFHICLSLWMAMASISCTDEIDRNAIYVFKGESAMDYIRTCPDLTLFAKILEKSSNSTQSDASVASLLNTYGNYTVFAPTNDAVMAYLDSVYGDKDHNIDTLSKREANKIALNCVLEGALRIQNLYEGALVEGTLDDHHIIVEFGNYGDGTIVRLNRRSRILQGDLKVTNGYVHIVDRVITPGPSSIAGLIYETPNLHIFSLLLDQTSWGDSLLRYEDKTYNDKTYHEITGNSTIYPRYRIRVHLFCGDGRCLPQGMGNSSSKNK